MGLSKSFNPAEAEEGFKSPLICNFPRFSRLVSIQPKPKKGLKEEPPKHCIFILATVSIQPKPKKGLKGDNKTGFCFVALRFNPAEAEEGFKSEFQTG